MSEYPGRDVRAWLAERAERPHGETEPEATIAYFGDGVVAIAGRDHAARSPEGAIREGAELILQGLLLEDFGDRVREKTLEDAHAAFQRQEERWTRRAEAFKSAIEVLGLRRAGDTAVRLEELASEAERILRDEVRLSIGDGEGA